MFRTRLDRCLTLCVFRALGTTGSGRRGGRLPVLMYHSISNDLEQGVHPYYKVATAPARFAEHMQWLSDHGFRGTSVEEALPGSLDARNDSHRVAITFDDGFQDFYMTAWPVLQRHGFTATIYLPTAFVASRRKSFCGKDCLTWDEVRELRRHGIRVGSHTVNHPRLYDLAWKEIGDELRLSKDCIEQQLGEEIRSFAYPYAFPQEDRGFTELLAAQLRLRGYRNCATTMIGRAQPCKEEFHLPRLPINSDDDQALFSAKLAGAYDWVSAGQGIVRRARGLARGRCPRRA